MKCSSMIFVFPDGIAKNSRFLEGHFPQDPIVPGAILLGLAAQKLGEAGIEIANIARMKFVRTLRPLQPFEINVDPSTSPSTVHWVSAGQTIAKAAVQLQASCD